MLRTDQGSVTALQVGGSEPLELWRRPLPSGLTPVRLGHTPDLDGDRLPEIRVGMTDGFDPLAKTWILSGGSGRLLYVIDGRWPFDPWAPSRTVIDRADSFLDALPPWLVAQSSGSYSWKTLEHQPLPANVRHVLGGDGTLDQRQQHSGLKRGIHELPIRGSAMQNPRSLPESPDGFLGPQATTVKLVRVQFANSHTVVRDTIPQVPYPPEWFDSNIDGDADDWSIGDIRAPICYSVPNPVQVSTVVLHVDPPNSIPTSATVYGRILGVVDSFTSTALSYNATGELLTATMTGSASFWTTIARVADYPIDWRVEYTTPAGKTTLQAGTSRNHIHWVLLAPTGSFPLYYSLIDIGCRTAHGLDGSNHRAVADAVFTEFADRVVVRASDVLEGVVGAAALTYYQNWTTGVTSVAALLAGGDGQCNAWAMFFIRCLHAVGIDPPDERLRVSYNQSPNPYGAGAVMLVKNWTFGGSNNRHGTSTVYPHMNIWNTPELGLNGVQHFYRWLFANVSDSGGVAGQGPTGDPASFFDIHFIVEVGGGYYDPSYGNTYLSFGAFETTAMEAYGLDFSTANNPFTVVESDVGVDLDGGWFGDERLGPGQSGRHTTEPAGKQP